MEHTIDRANPFQRLRLGISSAIKQVRCRARDRRTGTFVVSFPKTGRTWLRVMVGRALVELYGLPPETVLDTFRVSRALPGGAVRFTHGGPLHLFDPRPFDELTFDQGLYSGRRVVHLIRDARDTLVSYYFQVCKREKVFSGDMAAFLRDPCYGARKLIRFYTLWFQNRREPSAFVVERYEDLHRDAAGRLRALLHFLGIEGAVDEAARVAVEFASFENMRRLEAGQAFNRDMMKPGNPADGESFKTRKGKVGGFAEYLNADDLAYIDAVIAELGDPACDWYKHNG
jgi:hypothetical protein